MPPKKQVKKPQYETPDEWKCVKCQMEMGENNIPKVFGCGCTTCEECVQEEINNNNMDFMPNSGLVYCPKCCHEQNGNEAMDVDNNKKLLRIIVETREKLGLKRGDYADEHFEYHDDDKLGEHMNSAEARKLYLKKTRLAGKSLDTFAAKISATTEKIEKAMEALKKQKKDEFWETKAFPLNVEMVKLSKVLDDFVTEMGKLTKELDARKVCKK